jgi:hypothetical protein
MPYGLTNFRSIVIKSYYILPFLEIFQKEEEKEIEGIEPLDDDKDESIDAEEQPVMKYSIVVIH